MVINICDENKKDALVKIINRVIDENQWSSKEAAHILQIALSDVSLIKGSKASKFSLDRLLIFLVRLDHEVTITISSQEVMRESSSLSKKNIVE